MNGNRIFISYSHSDRTILEQLLIHLRGAQCDIDCWSDHQIKAGDEWRKEIRSAIDRADIAVLLVSAPFLASPFIATHELPQILTAAQKRALRVVPVVVKSCAYGTSALASFQFFPDPRRPICRYRGDALQEQLAKFAQYIRALCVKPSPNDDGVTMDSNSTTESANSWSKALLTRFVETEEPDILASERPSLALQRAYRLLVHLFQTGTFVEFCAFDLAFHRWAELLDPGTQTMNFSKEIFRSVEDLLKSKRCGRFRRLLVIPAGELKTDRARCVLRCIREWETALNTKLTNALVETRVMKAPESKQATHQIARLCDFALFIGEPDRFMSIVEHGLKTTNVRPDDDFSECIIDTDRQHGHERHLAFDEYWRSSEPLAAFDDGGPCPVPSA